MRALVKGFNFRYHNKDALVLAIDRDDGNLNQIP